MNRLFAFLFFVAFSLRVRMKPRFDRIRLSAEALEVMAFITGAILSGLSGWLGMTVATLGNVRTTVACTGTKQEAGSLNAGLKVRGALPGAPTFSFAIEALIPCTKSHEDLRTSQKLCFLVKSPRLMLLN